MIRQMDCTIHIIWIAQSTKTATERASEGLQAAQTAIDEDRGREGPREPL